MQSGRIPSIALLFAAAFLAGRAGAQSLTAAVLDAGGQRSSASNLVIDASIGGFGGIGAVASEQIKHGYAGQLYEVTALAVDAMPGTVPEGSPVQLAARAQLDDDSVLPLAASDIVWQAAAFPIAAIGGNGSATTTVVFADTLARATGAWLGVVGSCSFTVLDANPDNFDSYAGDGLNDGWQVRFFGIGSTNASPTRDADGDGCNNLAEYVADSDPIDNASFHHIVAESNQPAQRLVFFPSSSLRAYSLESTTNLSTGTWHPVAGQTNIAGTGAIMPLVDTAPAASANYRVKVLVP